MTRPVRSPSELDPAAWWTAAEYAGVLGVTARWLEDRCAPRCADPLPHRRLAGSIRFSPADRREIEAHSAGGASLAATPAQDIAELSKQIAGVRKLQRAAA